MKSNTRTTACIAVLFVASVSLSLVGCGGSDNTIVAVGGIVTLNGNPVSGIEVTFEPLPIKDVMDVGPFSTGVTDADGQYTLETRYGDPGAVVGAHRVYFETVGFDPESADEARSDLQEAKQSGDQDAVEKAQAALKSSKSGTKIPSEFGEEKSTVEYTVSSGGSKTANFDL